MGMLVFGGVFHIERMLLYETEGVWVSLVEAGSLRRARRLVGLGGAPESTPAAAE